MKVLEKAVKNVSRHMKIHYAFFYTFLTSSPQLLSLSFSLVYDLDIILTAKKLGEQCFYDLTCLHTDENSVCMQINHNAICECKEGYHVVTHLKPTKRTFCTQGKHQ